MAFNKESDFEEALIKILSEKGWEKEVLKNYSEKDLLQNWADILFENNRDIDRLNDYPLTDGEMQQILEQIEALRTPLKLNSFINGKSVSIVRDNPDDKLHFGNEVKAMFFGFTGTPIQEENQKKKNTTTSVFGNELHRYSIADGIRDKKGYSKEAWMERLPQLLKQAGMLRDQPCSVVRSEEGLKDYIMSMDVNFTHAREDGQNISDTMRAEMEQVKKDTAQTERYIKSYYSTVTVPATQIMPNEKQILSLELDDGLVEGVSLVGMDSDNAKISLRSDAKYTYTGADGQEKVLTGDQIMKALSENKQGEKVVQTVTQKAGGR